MMTIEEWREVATGNEPLTTEHWNEVGAWVT